MFSKHPLICYLIGWTDYLKSVIWWLDWLPQICYLIGWTGYLRSVIWLAGLATWNLLFDWLNCLPQIFYLIGWTDYLNSVIWLAGLTSLNLLFDWLNWLPQICYNVFDWLNWCRCFLNSRIPGQPAQTVLKSSDLYISCVKLTKKGTKHKWATTRDFQQCLMCDQQRLRPACA